MDVRRSGVGVGKGQVGRAGLQHVDQVLREVLTDLHDRQVRTESRSFGAQRRAGGSQARDNLVGGRVVDEVDAAGKVGQAETRRIEVDTAAAQGRLAGFVEGQLQRLAAEQVDAVERSVLRGR